MPEARPAIPEETQRAVRKRCGFGCIVCGCPLYDIHHVRPWAESKSHDQENLTLLCQAHHRQRTNGLMSDERVAMANASPANHATGISAPHRLYFEGDRCQVWLGDSGSSNISKTKGFAALVIDRMALLAFRFDAGNLLLTLALFDEFNRPVLGADEGLLRYDISRWDIQFKGRVLRIRDAPRQTRLRLRFEPPNAIRVLDGLFFLNGVGVRINRHGILLLNNGVQFTYSDMTTVPQADDRWQVGIGLGELPANIPIALSYSPVQRVPADCLAMRPRPMPL